MTLESLIAAARVRNAYTPTQQPKHEPVSMLAKHLGSQFQPLRWPTVDQAQLRLLQAIALQARIDAAKKNEGPV